MKNSKLPLPVVITVLISCLSCTKPYNSDTDTLDTAFMTAVEMSALSGGKIPAMLHLNWDSWSYGRLTIPSLEEAEGDILMYFWEIDHGKGWEELSRNSGATLSIGYTALVKEATVRRVAVTREGLAYTNECLVIDNFFRPDPTMGSTFGNPLNAGTHSTDFHVRGMVDTSAPGFYDNDRYSYYGNDGYVEFLLEREFEVRVAIGTLSMGEMHMRIHSYTTDTYWWNAPLPMYDFFTFDQMENESRIFLTLPPGRYNITLQAAKYMNAGQPNGPIFYSITGMLAED